MPDKINQARILVADDVATNRQMIAYVMQKNGYEVLQAENGVEAVQHTRSFLPDLIFMDVMMPEMDGYEACTLLKEDPATQHIPIVVVTALSDKDSKIRGLKAGANDFLTKPIEPIELLARTRNLLKVKEFGDFLRRHNETLEAEVLARTRDLQKALAELHQTNESLVESQRQIKKSWVDTIDRLTIVAEFKEEETGAHIRRTSRLCGLLAREYGQPDDFVENITCAAPMHDIGKVCIPSEIILKPGRLSFEEFALMKTHTTLGARIVSGSGNSILDMAQRIAQNHHERWDCTGYPNGVGGDAIPLEARIMHIADQYDALRSRRSYKPPFDHQTVCNIILSGDGRTMPAHFDPRLLEIFKDVHLQFDAIFAGHV